MTKNRQNSPCSICSSPTGGDERGRCDCPQYTIAAILSRADVSAALLLLVLRAELFEGWLARRGAGATTIADVMSDARIRAWRKGPVPEGVRPMAAAFQHVRYALWSVRREQIRANSRHIAAPNGLDNVPDPTRSPEEVAIVRDRASAILRTALAVERHRVRRALIIIALGPVCGLVITRAREIVRDCGLSRTRIAHLTTQIYELIASIADELDAAA